MITTILKELCKINGMIEGEIKVAPMKNQDEENKVTNLIRAKKGIKNAIEEIQSFRDDQ